MPDINKLDPSYYIHQIAHSDAYLDTQNRELDLRTPDALGQRRVAIEMGARSLVDVSLSGYVSPESRMFDVISQLGSFSESILAIRELQANRAPRSERLPHLKEVIHFNQSLRDLIDIDPSLTFTELTLFLRRMHTAIDGPANVRKFDEELRGNLVGMRHELGAEQEVGAIGMKYRIATAEEELEGIDVKVFVDGVWVPLDIKSSPQGAASALKRNNLFKNTAYPIWSHLSDQDFGNGFRVPFELAKLRAINLEKEIQIAHRRLLKAS